MKAMVLDAIANIETAPLQLRDMPVPEPGQGEIRVRVHCCGICRTDLHVIEGELPEQSLPLIPGHQVVGVVDKLGPGCARFDEGQRVGIAWLRHTCGECDFCRRGKENLCESALFTGYHRHGGFAEYALVPEDFAYAIPEPFDDVDAAPLLCAGIIGYRSLRRANVPDGGSLAIYGFGSSAHIIFQVAKRRGYRIFVVTRGDDHVRLARDMGADWADQDADAMPEPADSAIIFAPVGHLVPVALEHLRKGGTLALAGIYMSDIPQMNYEKHLFYERDVHSVTANTRDDGNDLLREAAQIPIRPRVSTYPLEDANRALQDLKADRISGSGVLIVKDGE
jgi:alcohol dehydrogenase, propanol-preferring